MTNNITFTRGSDVVTIATKKVDDDWNNEIKILEIAKTASDTEAFITKLINLRKIKRALTFYGEIAKNGEVIDFSGSDTAKEQRTKLRNMIDSNDDIAMVYDDVSANVGILKCKITEDARDDDTPDSYSVVISVIQGTNAVS